MAGEKGKDKRAKADETRRVREKLMWPKTPTREGP